jgi:hypothetical protein
LKLRSTDLDNIVDDLSEGEGDEEEGGRRRVEQDARQDRYAGEDMSRSV